MNKTFDRIITNIFNFYKRSWVNDRILYPHLPTSEISSVKRLVEMGDKITLLIDKEVKRGCDLDWEYVLKEIRS